MTFRRVAASIAIAAGLLAPAAAFAQEDWKEQGDGQPPPDDHKKKEKENEESKPDAPEKPTRFLLDLKIGPAFILATRQSAIKGSTEFALQLNAGYAVSHDLATKGDALYLTLSPFLIVGSDLTLVAPLGAQYDLPLTMIPYKGLHAYARASVGYAYYKPVGLAFDQGIHSLAVQPAIGARLTFSEHFHVGIEPIGFDIVHTFLPKAALATGQAEDTIVAFQLAILGGVRF